MEVRVIKHRHHPVFRAQKDTGHAVLGLFAGGNYEKGTILFGTCDYLRGGLILCPNADKAMYECSGDIRCNDNDMELVLPGSGGSLIARGISNSYSPLVNDPRNTASMCQNASRAEIASALQTPSLCSWPPSTP